MESAKLSASEVRGRPKSSCFHCNFWQSCLSSFAAVRYNPRRMVGNRVGKAMGNEVRKLSARGAATVAEPGRHSDGGGLYLNVTETGARSWLFMWKVAGRRREMGLGSARAVPLARARELAAECRAAVAAGRDPLQERVASKTAKRAIPTFGACADEFIAAKQAE